MPELSALIFDVDGTLADTEKDGHRVAFNQAFREKGLDWNWSVPFYGSLLEVPGGKERIRFYLEQYCPNFQAPQNLSEWIAELHKSKNKYYQRLLAEGKIPLRPGVRRLLTEAREKGVRLAIATTSALPNALTLLEKSLDPSWFEVIAAGDIVSKKKPAPDIYFYVLEKMDLPASQCLVFEDSSQGLIAANKAGLKTIVTVNNYTKSQNFSNAVLVLSDLGELEEPFNIIVGQIAQCKYLDMEALYQLSNS